MLGRAKGELPNKLEQWLELVHPEDRGHVLDRMPTEDAADDYFHEAEFRLRGSDSQCFAFIAEGASSNETLEGSRSGARA